jgi:phosphoglycolate phosphatase-like HAD superfamily hydrolase
MNLLFESWKKYIVEATQVRKLRVFDMDDTLLTTSSMVVVRDKSGKEIKKITPAEYAVYEKQPNEVMDYSEFKTLKDPTPIDTAMRSFKRIYNSGLGEHRKLAILTARASDAKQEIKLFLQKMGLDPSKIEVVTVGDSDPAKKKQGIEQQIKAGYNDIAFFDDSGKNRQAVNQLQQDYPEINLFVGEQPAKSKRIRISKTYLGLKDE